MQNEPCFHAEIERRLKRLDRVVPAVGISRKIRLAHPANDMLEPPAISHTGGKGQEENVAAGNEGARKPVFEHRDFDVTRERRLADFPQNAEIDGVIVTEALDPVGKCQRQFAADVLAALEFDHMTLPVIKPDSFDALELVQRPGEAGCRILPARKEHKGAIVIEVHAKSFSLLCLSHASAFLTPL